MFIALYAAGLSEAAAQTLHFRLMKFGRADSVWESVDLHVCLTTMPDVITVGNFGWLESISKSQASKTLALTCI